MKHGTLFPADQPGALGLLFGVSTEDACDRMTLVVDPEWLRTLLAGIADGHDLGRMPVPASVSLPIAVQGWDDDWDGEEHEELGHMHWLFRQAGWDWPLLARVVDLLEGFEEQHG